MNVAGGYRAVLDRPGAWWTIASNAIPVVGVVFFGWQALPLLVFYWLENVVIGALNVPKLIISGATKPMPQPLVGLFFAAFFIVHYGMFCFVHGIFVFAMFTMSDLVHGGVEPASTSFDLITSVSLVMNAELFWSTVALVAIRLGEFVLLWLGGGVWRTVEPQTQIFEPYGRIIVMHLTIFIATIPVLVLGQPMLAVLALALLKTALELGSTFFQLDPSASDGVTKST